MKRFLAFFLCVALTFVPFHNAKANPAAVVLLGGEGLGLLSGLAIKQGLRFAGAQAARVFFQSAAKRSPALLGTLSSMTANGTRLNGAMKYTISGAAATALMLGLTEYADEIGSYPTNADGLPLLEYYGEWVDSGAYYGTSTWYMTHQNIYNNGVHWQTGGINIHYLDVMDGMWKSEGMTTANSIYGTHLIATQQVDARNAKFVVTYVQPNGSVRSAERYFPVSTTVALGDPVVLRHPFPLDGVTVGEPRAVPIPLTGEFDIYIPFPMDQVYEELEANPTFVDVGPGTIPVDPPIDPPITPPVTPPWVVPGRAAINLDPLRVAGDQLTNKFPFSIPWDVKRQLSVFDVEPKTPKFDVNIKVPLFSTSFDMKFPVDFSMFDGLAAIVRWFLILAFDVGLILSLRRFFPE